MNQLLTNLKEYRMSYASQALKELVDFVRIPNNVFDTSQIQENAKVLKHMMEKRGITVEFWTTPSGKPLVFGELRSTNASKTILVYGHYDGVPVEPSEWHSDPYEPVVRQSVDGEGIPFDQLDEFSEEWRVFGRSIADSKNAIVAILTALDSIRYYGQEPSVHLKFLFDGEEEIESPGLHRILEEHKERLTADCVLSASGETHQSGLPTVELGIRGMLQFDVTTYTTASELHSGHFGNFAPNAVMRMSHLLSSLKDEEGNVQIVGFYDDILPLSASEREAIHQIPRIEKQLYHQFGISAQEIEGKSLQELINLPTLNVRGVIGGYVGESARNIIPNQAHAEIDIRLVKGMDPRIVFGKIIDFLEKKGWTVLTSEPMIEDLRRHKKVIKVIQKAAFPATRTPLDSKIANFVVDAVKRVMEETIVMPTEGGSLPLYVFEEKGIPVIGLPTSNFDCNQHTHDENLQIGYFYRAIDIFASLFISK